MARTYRMRRRAEAHDQTRSRIMRATLELHDENGVATTTFAAIAERAGVGQATVHRHFPTLSDLVQACGVHVWQEMRPPVPEDAGSVFAGLKTRRQRLEKLVQELDQLYDRGAHRLRLAARDRHIVAELDGFLRAVDAGIEALVRQALAGSASEDKSVRVVMAFTSLPVWTTLNEASTEAAARAELKVSLLECAVKAIERIAASRRPETE
jgi:AcrR family transcriptional regulator